MLHSNPFIPSFIANNLLTIFACPNNFCIPKKKKKKKGDILACV
jgi:hypothetical protein